MNPAANPGNPGQLFWPTTTPNQTTSPADPRAAGAHVDPAALERQAVMDFLHQAASPLLQQAFEYVEQNSSKFSQLEAVVPLLSSAVEAYGANDDARAFNLAFQVYRELVTLRASLPDLPPIRH